jgi:hypothetical protein
MWAASAYMVSEFLCTNNDLPVRFRSDRVQCVGEPASKIVWTLSVTESVPSIVGKVVSRGVGVVRATPAGHTSICKIPFTFVLIIVGYAEEC